MKASDFRARLDELVAVIGGDPEVVVSPDGSDFFEGADLECQWCKRLGTKPWWEGIGDNLDTQVIKVW